jgi:GNAT superfamily N-acetyltransferase
MVTADVRLALPDDAPGIASVQVRGWQVAYRGIVPDPFLDAMSIPERTERWRSIVSGALGDTDAAGRPVHSTTFVAVEDEEVIGFASVGARRDESDAASGELWALYVDPDRWRHNAGRRLIDAATSELSSRGYRRAVLWVLEANDRGRRFYEAVGWGPDGGRAQFPIAGVDIAEVRYRRNLA